MLLLKGGFILYSQRKIVAFLIALMLMVTLAGCQPSGDPEPAPSDEEIEAAETEVTEEEKEDYTGEALQIYAAYGGLDEIAQKFEEETGIPVEMLSMSSGEVLSRMRAEEGRALGDVWFGGGIDSFMVAAEEGLLHPYHSPEAEAIEDRFKDPDGYWTGVSIVLVTYVVNQPLAEDLDVPIPMTWEALTDPMYAGEVSMPNPGISGTAYTAIASMLQILGEEDGWAYLDALDANIPYYAERGSEPPQQASLGEVLVGISPDGINSQREGYPVEVVYPEDGTPWWHSPVAIIEGTNNVEAAQKFVDWTLTEEGQAFLAEVSPRPSTRPNVPLPEDIPSLEELNLVDYDFTWAAEERDRIVNEWTERYGN